MLNQIGFYYSIPSVWTKGDFDELAKEQEAVTSWLLQKLGKRTNVHVSEEDVKRFTSDIEGTVSKERYTGLRNMILSTFSEQADDFVHMRLSR